MGLVLTMICDEDEEVDRLIDILQQGDPDGYICPQCNNRIHLEPLAILKNIRSFNVVLCPICDYFIADPRD